MVRIARAVSLAAAMVCAVISVSVCFPAFAVSGDAPQVMVRFLGVNDFGLSAELARDRLNGPANIPENVQLRALAGNPLRARFLIDSRLPSQARALLDATHPTEELHRWLVLEYPNANAARGATNAMQRNPNVFVAVTQDGKRQLGRSSQCRPASIYRLPTVA